MTKMACSNAQGFQTAIGLLVDRGVPLDQAYQKSFKAFCGSLPEDMSIGFPSLDEDSQLLQDKVEQYLRKRDSSNTTRSAPAVPRHNDVPSTTQYSMLDGTVITQDNTVAPFDPKLYGNYGKY